MFLEVQLSELSPSPLPLIDCWHAQAKMIAEGTQFGPYRLIEKIGAGGMGKSIARWIHGWSVRLR